MIKCETVYDVWMGATTHYSSHFLSTQLGRCARQAIITPKTFMYLRDGLLFVAVLESTTDCSKRPRLNERPSVAETYPAVWPKLRVPVSERGPSIKSVPDE